MGMKKSGFTLLELTFTVMLAAVALGLAAPIGSRALDGLAAGSARDTAMGFVHHTRIHARLHGGARLLILPDSVIEVWAGDSLRARWVGHDSHVTVDPGRPDSVSLEWDALGVGRVANRTIRFRRGGAEAGLVISSTGRVRRQ